MALDQLAREGGLLARLQELLPHVDQLDLAAWAARSMRSGQFEQRVLAALGVVAALQAGRGRAQHHAGPRGLRPHDGHVAAVVARGLLLLVAPSCSSSTTIRPRLRTGAKTPERVPTTTPARARTRMRRHCSVRSVSVKRRVQDGHAVAEAREELAGHGGGEGDLRHQQQRAAAHRERRLDGGQVDFGLARAGDAVQQEASGNARPRWPRGSASKAACWCGIQRVRRPGADRPAFTMRSGLSVTNRPCAPGSAPPRWRSCTDCLPVLQIVRAGVQFQKGDQLALGLGELGAFRAAAPVPRAAAPKARAAGRAPPALSRRR